LKVALFVTCVADLLAPSAALATARLLRRLGCDVDFPEGQTCCGQPAWNSGYAREAERAARAMLDAFETADYVVSPSGSCVGMVRHSYPHLFSTDAALAKRARRLAEKTFELSQFVVNVLKVTDVGATFSARATFHPSCHAARLLGVRDEPLRLLGAVRGLTLLPLTRGEDCCGFGGTFAVKLASISGAMADEKAERVEATGATHLVSTDLGCLLNIAGRLAHRGAKVRALHLAEVLTEGPWTEVDRPSRAGDAVR
jgi:L-lactate dehydrogenase complex protein LldE